MANGSLTRGDFFQQKKLKTVEDGSCRGEERFWLEVVSSGRVEGGTWAAGRSSLSRPLEIFLEGEGSRGSFDERDS